MPLYADRIGQGGVLGTTQADVVSCLAAIRPEDGITDFEAETYAWGALPIEHRTTSLAEGIALELRWAAARMDECGLRR